MSIILAGDRSGTGKTTLTLALLAALKKRGHIVQSFKVGPDYIDTMFHSAKTGRPCDNLDPVLTSEAYVLVVDCGRMARALAALVQGYRNFDRRVTVAGVILNRVGSDRHLQLLSDALAAIKMPIFGVFRREKDIQLPSRHLGLVPTEEVNEFEQIADRLAAIGERCFDWEQLAPMLDYLGTADRRAVEFGDVALVEEGKRVRVAIARDAAFNFYYPDNFEALETQGAALIYWSPLKDKALPETDGFYFGGGFPEVFANELANNKPVRMQLKQAIEAGMPTYAECGGLMYLSQTLIDFDGQAWPMVNAIPQTVKMGGRLALGYRRAKALATGPLLDAEQSVGGHEFHRSSVVETLAAPLFETQRYWGETGETHSEGVRRASLHES